MDLEARRPLAPGCEHGTRGSESTPADRFRVRPSSLVVLAALAVALSVACAKAPTQEAAPPAATPTWQTVEKADKIAGALFAEVFSLRGHLDSLNHLPTAYPDREEACPGPYRRTLLYGIGVEGSLHNPRAWPRARMVPTGIALLVDVRIGDPCLPNQAPVHVFGDVAVQSICYGRDCKVIIDRLSRTLARLKERYPDGRD